MALDLDNLREKITEIIILSLYGIETKEIEEKKLSAQEILDFKKRAFDKYRGMPTGSHSGIIVNTFFDRVTQIVALTMKAIQEEVDATRC